MKNCIEVPVAYNVLGRELLVNELIVQSTIRKGSTPSGRQPQNPSLHKSKVWGVVLRKGRVFKLQKGRGEISGRRLGDDAPFFFCTAYCGRQGCPFCPPTVCKRTD